MTLAPVPLAIDAGRGPALLLLHPFPLDHRAFAGLAAALEGHCRVLVPDLPGFGAAAAGGPPLGTRGATATMDAMAHAVAAALDARGIRPAAVAGNSMGGYVALALAAARPELVPALVLVASRARADLTAERENRERQVAALDAAGNAGAGLLVEWMLPRLLGPHAAPELVARVRGWILECVPAGARAALAGMAERPDRTDLVRGFTGPFLALGGEHDPIVTPAEVETVAALAPRGRSLAVTGAGHLPQIERESDVAGAILSVLKEATRG